MSLPFVILSRMRVAASPMRRPEWRRRSTKLFQDAGKSPHASRILWNSSSLNGRVGIELARGGFSFPAGDSEIHPEWTQKRKKDFSRSSFFAAVLGPYVHPSLNRRSSSRVRF